MPTVAFFEIFYYNSVISPRGETQIPVKLILTRMSPSWGFALVLVIFPVALAIPPNATLDTHYPPEETIERDFALAR